MPVPRVHRVTPIPQTPAMTDTPEEQKPINTTEILLQNPVRHHFATFVFGNSTQCDRVLEPNSHEGKTVVICGAGPTLCDTAAKFCPRGDEVWGCNSAAVWLYENGHKVTHGFTVDQTAHMLEEWATTPPLDYYIASTCNPNLGKMLMDAGRVVTYFHNYAGIEGGPVSYAVCGSCNQMTDADMPACPHCGSTDLDSNTVGYEDWLYATLYPSTVRAGSGLNATTRAIDVALYMGFSKIYVLGADCAMKVLKPRPKDAPQGSPAYIKWLTEDVVMHADGGHALASDASSMTLEGEIDGRYWLTKPDMAITARYLRDMKLVLGSRISIVGDTLVRVLINKDDKFCDRLPSLIGKDGQSWSYSFASEHGSGITEKTAA